MNAMTRDLPGKDLDETIPHVPCVDPADEGSARAPSMPNTTPQAHHRYIFSSGARPLEGYTIKRAIGRGGFGEVYYATSDAGKEVALKLITRNIDVERRGVMQCMNLKSPNLITIFDLKTSDAGDPFVIMEYVAGPSLASILAQHPKGLPPHEVRTWLKGLVEGVAYLHDHGIVHRDLKPANLFLEQGVVKIGDYGLSKLITQSQGSDHSESIGTCHYMAPEISTGRYHKPIDIYAIGVILYEMVTGRVPFDGETVGEILMKHLTGRPDLQPLPEPYRSIVGKALAKDPNHRPAGAYALLPPADAPKAPEVRFIGEKNTPADGPTAPADDTVLRIGAEEPVFYIGPDTRPPARPRRATFHQWLWGPRPAAERAPNRPAAPPPRVREWAGYRARRQVRQPEPAPPTPPALPGTRMRVAELATSMLWAAPLSALVALPASGMLGVDLLTQPQQFADLVAMTLVGTWSLLVPHKLWEGRSVDRASRRLVYLVIGLLLGGFGLALGEWTHLQLGSWWIDGPGQGLKHLAGPTNHPAPLGWIAYFGLLFGANGWWKMVSRGRRARFRLLPVAKSAALGLLLGALWPFPQPWGFTVATLVAIVVQLVSPWNEAAAAYVRAARRQGRRDVIV